MNENAADDVETGDLDARKKKQAEELFKSTAEHVGEDDAEDAARSGREKVDDLSGDPPGPLRKLWEDLKTLISMVKDYTTRSYTEVPWTTIAAATAAVLYFVSPIDAIPDMIPGVGYVDDAAVIALCVTMVRDDIEAYRRWKATRA